MAGRTLVVSLLALALAASSCDSLTDPSAALRLQAAESRWAAANLRHSYSFEMTRSCYCGYPGALPATWVHVSDGLIADAIDRESGTPLDPAARATVPTVTGLFDLIRDALSDGAHEMRVRYHPAHGAPMEIFIDRIRQAEDDELSVTLQNLEPVLPRASQIPSR